MAPKPPPGAPAPASRRTNGGDWMWIGEAVNTVMAVAVGGSAAVVAALGQFALAVVLALVALGIVLRLWRTRRRRRKAASASRG